MRIGKDAADENQFENIENLEEKIDLPGWSKMSLSLPTLQAL